MSNGRKQGWFESDDDYRDRMSQEADEGRIERSTGDTPSQSWFESDENYESRISREADEDSIEASTGSAPSQGWFESDDCYEERIEQTANERVIEDVTGESPSQGWFESDDDYHDRTSREADEATVEQTTGDRPSQGWFESDSDYEERVSNEADECDSDSNSDSGSGGCFLTTACVEAAGLPDNCRELSVLRQFRDNYLAILPNGPELISIYYAEAPIIVTKIHSSSARLEILRTLFREVRFAVALIESGKSECALLIYSAMFARLRAQFPSS